MKKPMALRRLNRGPALLPLVVALAVGGCQGEENEPAALVHTQYGSFDIASERLFDLAPTKVTVPESRVVKVVQFNGPIQLPWRQALVEHGLQIRGYLPDHALLVVARQGDLAWLSGQPMVRAVVDQPRLWRLDRRLVRVGAEGVHMANPDALLDLTLEVSDAGARGAVEQAVRAAGGEVVAEELETQVSEGRVLHVHLTGQSASVLVAHPDVIALEPFVPLHTMNDVSYGIVQSDQFHDGAVWRHGLHGEGQVVGICDVGVFTNSCFFPSDKIVQYENITPVTAHDQSHGTHTAGSVAGDQNGNGIYDLYDGMAPGARLYVQDAGTQTTGELSLPGDLSSLFGTAYAAGARIHSNSWGGDTNIYSARERTLDAFVASHRDFLILMANGNNGDGPGTVGSPATAKNLISVGAVDGMAPEDVAPFSAHGPTGDSRIKPTVTAPGVRVTSAAATACGTAVKSGTSMATPILAGAAALVRQYFTTGYYPSGAPQPSAGINPSAALIKATLLAGTDDMAGQETDGTFPSNGQGFGRVDLDNSLYFAGDKDRLFVKDDQEGLQQGQTFAVTLQSQGGPLHVALTWMDEPPAAGAVKVLVNDLDLEVQGPAGNYLGNNLTSGASQLGGQPDRANVEEVVFLPSVPAGAYTIVVRAPNIPMGPQPFAIAVTGLVTPVPGDSAASTGAVIAATPDSQAKIASTNQTCSGSNCPKSSGCTAGPGAAPWAVLVLLGVFVRRRNARAS